MEDNFQLPQDPADAVSPQVYPPSETENIGTNGDRVSGEVATMRRLLERMSSTITTQLSSVNDKVESLAQRVEAVEKTGANPTAQSARTAATPVPAQSGTSHLWADRDVSAFDPDELLVYPEDDPELIETDEAQGCQLHRVSAATESQLKDVFAKTVPNGTRRRWRQAFGMPACDATKCPKLDATIKAQVPKACKDADRQLGRLQALVLDAVGPLTHIVEQGQKGTLTPEVAAEAATQALRFLGNASASISLDRRRQVAEHINKDLKPLLEDEDRFRDAPPLLFGRDFEKSAKEHMDSVRSLRKIAQQPQAKTQFFRRSHPYTPAARGGGVFRGSSFRGGRGRYRPYQMPGQGKENLRKDGGRKN